MTTFAEAQEDIAQYEQRQEAAQAQEASASQATQQSPQPETQIAGTGTDQDGATETTQEDTSSFNISIYETETKPAVTQTAQQPTFNWKDEIKKIDRKELISELGLDPFAVELDQHLKGGGSAVDYINARAIDYNKFSDDALVKDSLRKEYPTLSPSQIETIFNRKYSIPEDATDDDKEFFTAQLQADAYKIRQSKIAEQQKFKVPEAIILTKDEAYEQWKQDTESRSDLIGQLNNYYLTHEATKKLNESKRVVISLGENVAPFNFTIDRPELITQTFTDGGKIWQKLTTTETGEPDVKKQQLIALFTFNPQKFIQDIFKYGQSQGLKDVVSEGQNAQRPQAKVANLDPNATPTYRVGKFGG